MLENAKIDGELTRKNRVPIIHTRASVHGRNAVSENKKDKMENMERNLKTVEDEIIHYFNNDFYGDLPKIFELINHPFNYNFKIKITDLFDCKILKITHVNDALENEYLIEIKLLINSYDIPYDYEYGILNFFKIKNGNLRLFIKNIKEFPYDKISFDKNKLQKLLLTMK